MVCLTGQIRRHVVIHSVFFERAVTQIGPQHGYHAQLVGALERRGDLFYLTTRLFRTEIDGCPDRHRTHIERLLDAGVERLVVFGWVAQGFVVVQLNEERNAVGIATRHGGQHAVGGGHAVTARLNRQLDDIFRIKIERVRGKRCPRRVFNALVNGQNREVPGSAQAAGIIKRLHVSQYGRRTVVVDHDAVYVIMARQIKLVGWNGHTTML
ncbi:Uncharacterised protein [Enterobacter hormaechei]|nr:Uncharacterised protein [Enterobacter hormaechei]